MKLDTSSPGVSFFFFLSGPASYFFLFEIKSCLLKNQIFVLKHGFSNIRNMGFQETKWVPNVKRAR